ncbi:hypothetical protein [Persephonella sp.]
MSASRISRILFILFTIGIFINCGGGGGDSGSNSNNKNKKILVYAVNQFPIYNFQISIYKIENNKKIFVTSYNSNFGNFFTEINWSDNEIIFIEIKGGIQDKDGNFSTFTDRIPNGEVLSGYLHTSNDFIIISPITTALVKFTGNNSQKYFELISKLPPVIKKSYLETQSINEIIDMLYYISKFISVSNIIEEISDDGLINGSTVKNLTAENLNILAEYLTKKGHFKDKLLEYCIRKLLNKDITSEISIGELENINTLECDGYGIKYLDGIEKLKNLYYLSLTSNSLTDITKINSLENLILLDVSGNFISDFNQLKNSKSGIIFAENNCIAINQDNTNILSDITSLLIFGLEYQDNCKDSPMITEFDYDLNSNSFIVKANSRFVSHCSLTKQVYNEKNQIDYIAGFGGNTPNIYADGVRRSISYNINNDIYNVYEFSCYNFEKISKNNQGYEIFYNYGDNRHIYKGKNILLKEKDTLKLQKISPSKENSTFSCPYLYNENNSLIALCNELYSSPTGVNGIAMRNYILLFNTKGNRLHLTDFKIISDNAYTGYWIFLGKYGNQISAVHQAGVYLFSIENDKISSLTFNNNLCNSGNTDVYFINNEYQTLYFPCVHENFTLHYNNLYLKDHFLINNGYTFKIHLDPNSNTVNFISFDKINLKFNEIRKVKVNTPITGFYYRKAFLRDNRLYLFLDKSILIFELSLPNVSLIKEIKINDPDIKNISEGYPLNENLIYFSYYLQDYSTKTKIVKLDSDETYFEFNRKIFNQDSAFILTPFAITQNKSTNSIINFNFYNGAHRINLYEFILTNP